jgi:hypothetical protein
MNTTNTRHKKTIITILVAGIIIGLTAGITMGIQLYQLSVTRVGFWESRVETTYIVLLSLRHQIQGSNSIRTTINLGNTATTTININCTLYYKATTGDQIAQHSFNTTINAGQTRSQAFTVTPVNVSQFVGTDVSIFEY